VSLLLGEILSEEQSAVFVISAEETKGRENFVTNGAYTDLDFSPRIRLVTLSYILISYFTILLNPLDYAVL
jgi:hypothetical protein